MTLEELRLKVTMKRRIQHRKVWEIPIVLILLFISSLASGILSHRPDECCTKSVTNVNRVYPECGFHICGNKSDCPYMPTVESDQFDCKCQTECIITSPNELETKEAYTTGFRLLQAVTVLHYSIDDQLIKKYTFSPHTDHFNISNIPSFIPLRI